MFALSFLVSSSKILARDRKLTHLRAGIIQEIRFQSGTVDVLEVESFICVSDWLIS